MQLYSLQLKDKRMFDKFLPKDKDLLSSYAFENIYLWKCMYEVLWTKINDSLCIFFKDNIGCFQILPPLTKNHNIEIISKCFAIMNSFNKGEGISRIENVLEKDLPFYKKLGYETILGGFDYVCKKSDLANLVGNAFKRKRASHNYFVKNYDFEYLPYDAAFEKECIQLFKKWIVERKKKNSDVIFQRLLEDNFEVFNSMLEVFKELDFTGRVVKVDGHIKAFTFGYSLGKDSFVILFEVCDLNFKGIAQYIFRGFSQELMYKDINIMDDSGLDSLKRVKLSYRPYKKINNYIARE